MEEISDPLEMRAWARQARAGKRRIGFVPTMGFLHEGHLRLVDRAAAASDAVVLSIFVNPLQFGPGEDFSRYPRDLDRDRSLARERGVNCLFLPDTAAMYRQDATVRIVPGSLADHLCGPWRPGHFEGVLTVVGKLFHLVEPDVAVFGRKDAQQARIIGKMVDDLDFPVEVLVAPTVREPDGLALSSRNSYLSPGERRVALALSQGLDAAHRRFSDGERRGTAVIRAARDVLDAQPEITVEYVEAVDPLSLAPLEQVTGDTLLAVAARIGRTRLIDNIILGRGPAGDERLA
jgi:pantoate--beta-alanine ligase